MIRKEGFFFAGKQGELSGGLASWTMGRNASPTKQRMIERSASRQLPGMIIRFKTKESGSLLGQIIQFVRKLTPDKTSLLDFEQRLIMLGRTK